MLRFVLTCLAAALAAPLPARAPAAALRDVPAIERRVFEAVNQERRRHGLTPLKWNERLAVEARRHSRNMADRWFFSHTDPFRGDLAERLNQQKIPWRRCAENIFSESGHRDPAKQAVEDWMRSPGHRRNILDAMMTETGVGAAQRGGGELFITQNFIRPPEPPRDRLLQHHN